MRPDDALLLDIRQAAAFIADFISGMSASSFSSDAKTQFATCYQLAVIGEAAGKLSAEIKDRYPEIQWKNIVGMRNHLVHAYHNVDSALIWESAANRTSELVTTLRPEFERIGD